MISYHIRRSSVDKKNGAVQMSSLPFISARPRASEYTIGICKEKAKFPND